MDDPKRAERRYFIITVLRSRILAFPFGDFVLIDGPGEFGQQPAKKCPQRGIPGVGQVTQTGQRRKGGRPFGIRQGQQRIPEQGEVLGPGQMALGAPGAGIEAVQQFAAPVNAGAGLAVGLPGAQHVQGQGCLLYTSRCV